MKKRRSRIRQWLFSLRLWLKVGIGIKRWLLVLAIATFFMGMAWGYTLLLMGNQGWIPGWLFDILVLDFLPSTRWRIIVPLVVGSVGVLAAVIGMGGNLVAPFRRPDESVVQSIYHHQQQNRGPRIVAIGGGTGLPGVLRGLTAYTRHITAIVTVADDGGSSGRLRRELGMLPPGDFRNNIAALARDEPLMAQVMQYRFGASLDDSVPSQLQGHAFGNLLIAALTGITGSFDEGLLAMERVLAMNGRVMPSTLENVVLTADITRNGKTETVAGESAIPKKGGRIERVYLQPENTAAYIPAVKAILAADLIVLGPGSLYTSVLPNLVVEDIAKAVGYGRAPVVYVCNVATQIGETEGYTAGDHLQAILHSAPAVEVDYVLANDQLSLPSDRGGGQTFYVRPEGVDAAVLRTADLVDDARPWRHDSEKVAAALIDILKHV